MGKLISSQVDSQIELISLNAPAKYIQVLVDSYPRPITQSELARRSSVTKSAISKTRDALLELCDVSTLAFKRKLVLKSDFETFMGIFHVYFLQSETQGFFESEYARKVLNLAQIYAKLSEGLKEFSFEKYFSKANVEWAIELVLQNISSFQIQKETISIIAAALSDKTRGENVDEIIPYIQLMMKLFTNFEINVKNMEELKKTIVLRDKVYLFAKDNAAKAISKLDVIKEIPESEEKRTGIRFLSKIVESLLSKTSKEITEYLQQQAKAKGIRFLDEYEKIGGVH